MLMIVLMAFMVVFVVVIVAFVDMRSFSRLRLGSVFEGVGRTLRYAFRARMAAPIQIRFVAELSVAKPVGPISAQPRAAANSFQPPLGAADP